VQQAAQLGVSETGMRVLHAYYREELQRRKQWIEQMKDPDRGKKIIAETERMIEEDHRDFQREQAQKNLKKP
jgi:hypothetical protein